MRARVAHDAGQPKRHAGELHVEQLEPLPLSPTLARDGQHAVRSAPMLAPITTSTSSPARPKTRVGGSSSPRAFSRRRISRQARALHRETTTRARRCVVGSRKWMSPEPLRTELLYVVGEHLSGFTTPAYAYARNNPLAYIDPDGLKPGDRFKGRFAQNRAAADALDFINPRSKREFREYGGMVCRENGTGAYFATSPVTNNRNASCTPSNSPCPAGSTPVADYHTHGGEEAGYRNNQFSTDDIADNDKKALDGYLGTPSQGYWKYYNNSGRPPIQLVRP